jgi:hypothetical protein
VAASKTSMTTKTPTTRSVALTVRKIRKFEMSTFAKYKVAANEQEGEMDRERERERERERYSQKDKETDSQTYKKGVQKERQYEREREREREISETVRFRLKINE